MDSKKLVLTHLRTYEIMDKGHVPRCHRATELIRELEELCGINIREAELGAKFQGVLAEASYVWTKEMVEDNSEKKIGERCDDLSPAERVVYFHLVTNFDKVSDEQLAKMILKDLHILKES